MEHLALLMASLLLLAAPGPTNTLLATSGLAIGFRRSLPLLAAALAGYGIAIAALLLLIGPLLAADPVFQTALSCAVAAYLVYLATRLWTQGDRFHGDQSPVTMLRVLATTLVNPKSIILAFVIVPSGTPSLALMPWLGGLAGQILLTGVA